MDDKVKGLALLDKTILNNLRHKDYKRVTDLATEYYDIFTGQNLKKYLRQIVRREDEHMFKQRCEIYQSTIPATVMNLDEMFNKPLRSNRIYSSIEHPNINARNEIVDRMQKFYQGESESGVDAYLADDWKRLGLYDPNAYIAIEFSDFDPVLTKPYPFPLSYSSTEAIMMAYVNGTLDWIINKQDITYRTNPNKPAETKPGSKYIMYLDNWAVVLTEVDKDKRITDIPNPEFHVILNEDAKVNSVFVMQWYNTKAGGVPLFRAGYKKDPSTQGRTCVSNIHATIPFFKKELKTGSEFDLTMSMHAFPIRVQYGSACDGDKEHGVICRNGKTANGSNCPICKGHGMVPISTSSQDIVFIKPPRSKDDPVLDLEKAFIFKTPPVDFVKFQEDYLSRLMIRAKGAVFAEEALQRKSVDRTATEMDYSYDNVYDTFFAFAQKYSYAWKFIVKLIAVYTDNYSEDLLLYHQFPKDFKLKGLDTLLNEAKLASDSGLSQHAINAINNDVLEAFYADDQDTLTKIKVKDKFHPFSGKTQAEIQTIMMGDVLPFYKTLYQYFDVIFEDIDNEQGDKFYLMAYEAQKAMVKAKVADIIKQTDTIKAKKIKDFQSAMIPPATQPNAQ